MTKEYLQAMARPMFVFFGCTIPPFIGFDDGWRYILIPWFVWSVNQWFEWYARIKARK
jgi:hypothetical protein